MNSRLSFLIATALAAASTECAAIPQVVLLSEDFGVPAGPFTMPDWCGDPPVNTNVKNWKVWNTNSVQQPIQNPPTVTFAAGAARLMDTQRPIEGYLSLYHEIDERPLYWTVTVEAWIEQASWPSRPIPHLRTQSKNSHRPGETNSGWSASVNRFPVLVHEQNAWVASSYTLYERRWHTLELISTPSSSELRVWDTLFGSRPAQPLAEGDSLGELYRVEFGGVATDEFDYSIGRVLVVDNNPHQGPVLSIQNLEAGLTATLRVDNATPLGEVAFAYSLTGPGPTTSSVDSCGALTLALSSPVQTVASTVQANGSGAATVSRFVPLAAQGRSTWFQAIDLASCSLTPGVFETVR